MGVSVAILINLVVSGRTGKKAQRLQKKGMFLDERTLVILETKQIKICSSLISSYCQSLSVHLTNLFNYKHQCPEWIAFKLSLLRCPSMCLPRTKFPSARYWFNSSSTDFSWSSWAYYIGVFLETHHNNEPRPSIKSMKLYLYYMFSTSFLKSSPIVPHMLYKDVLYTGALLNQRSEWRNDCR